MRPNAWCHCGSQHCGAHPGTKTQAAIAAPALGGEFRQPLFRGTACHRKAQTTDAPQATATPPSYRNTSRSEASGRWLDIMRRALEA